MLTSFNRGMITPSVWQQLGLKPPVGEKHQEGAERADAWNLVVAREGAATVNAEELLLLLDARRRHHTIGAALEANAELPFFVAGARVSAEGLAGGLLDLETAANALGLAADAIRKLEVQAGERAATAPADEQVLGFHISLLAHLGK
eukprot:CAMPEP_0179102818 /NCGR_PEP_ID=MMETSP0796-20121207/47607_1 /TAXON_ID=73915 /ORGANISM="Pyrodinium bahamense, Strain pbaha01" /LENGTH=146 /DNA_ID=CAMNT_0020800703 /DNA_START=113 /DNA_END=552 /DNA_ORIENTATION=+